MTKFENASGKQRWTFRDLDGNEIVTTDPGAVFAEMWAKFWPIPSIAQQRDIMNGMEMGDEVLFEDCRFILRKHYRIV